jgi:hypothetical protein
LSFEVFILLCEVSQIQSDGFKIGRLLFGSRFVLLDDSFQLIVLPFEIGRILLQLADRSSGFDFELVPECDLQLVIFSAQILEFSDKISVIGVKVNGFFLLLFKNVCQPFDFLTSHLKLIFIFHKFPVTVLKLKDSSSEFFNFSLVVAKYVFVVCDFLVNFDFELSVKVDLSIF